MQTCLTPLAFAAASFLAAMTAAGAAQTVRFCSFPAPRDSLPSDRTLIFAPGSSYRRPLPEHPAGAVALRHHRSPYEVSERRLALEDGFEFPGAGKETAYMAAKHQPQKSERPWKPTAFNTPGPAYPTYQGAEAMDE
jgi:hypothetical protein